MTRKDYILIAASLKLVKPVAIVGQPVNEAITNTWRNTVSNLAADLARDNARFDSRRFLTAAGYSS